MPLSTAHHRSHSEDSRSENAHSEGQEPQQYPWQQLHEEACARGDYFYRDPETGYIVFTRIKHEARGYCCKSGCRHCAFGYVKSSQIPSSQVSSSQTSSK